MLKEGVNLLRGEVRGRVESGFPERVLNLCAEHGLAFWDLQWESAVAFTFTVTRRDWKRLRRLTRRFDCTLTALSWKGTPFFLGRIRHRYGLWVTLALALAGLIYGSFFIWDFRVEGNTTVSDQEILRALEECGVGFGTYAYGFSSFDLRNDLLLKLPQLSYIAVNVRGSRAYVQVRERVEAPQIITRRQPGNTVAAKDALVTEIQPLDGEKLVLPGTTVQAGQLLISGVVENDFSGARYLRGMGKVYGRTWYDLQCKVPLTVAQKTYTGEERTRYALVLGKRRVNLYFNSSFLGDTCDKMISQEKGRLPVTVVTETLRPYTLTQTRRTEAEALALADTILSARLDGYLEEGEVLSRELTYEIEGDVLVATLSAECTEQIGRFVEIPKE